MQENTVGGNGGNGGNGNGGGNCNGNGGGNCNGPITVGSASNLSQSHEEALLLRWAWQAEQTQILLGTSPQIHLS